MNSVNYIRLGEAIRAQRRRIGLSQEKLAEKCGLTGGYIGDVERADRVPSLDCICSLCLALGISPNQILQDSFPRDFLKDIPDKPLTLRERKIILLNTISNWFLSQLPDESMNGEPPVTKEQLLRLRFSMLGDDLPPSKIFQNDLP